MATKRLTCKFPNMINLAALLIVLLCILSPQFRYSTGSVFHFIGNTLQGQVHE
jgi:hypothetical protein